MQEVRLVFWTGIVNNELRIIAELRHKRNGTAVLRQRDERDRFIETCFDLLLQLQREVEQSGVGNRKQFQREEPLVL